MIADKTAGVVRTGVVDDEDVADFRADAGNDVKHVVGFPIARHDDGDNGGL